MAAVERTIRIGIAGYGVVGTQRHLCVDRLVGVEVVAVADQSLEARSRVRDSIRVHGDYQSLLCEDLDALFVCMSNDMAAAVTIAALEKGLHVFCEKPPARDMDEMEKVVNASKSRPSQTLLYGFNHRHHDSVVDALTIARSGEMGRVLSIRGIYGKSRLITFNQGDWRTKRKIAGGGVLLDQGIHMVDLIRLFGGEFGEVHSFVSNAHWQHDVEDNVHAILRGSTGLEASLTSSATQWRHRFNLEVTLEDGALFLGGILSTSKSYGAESLRVVDARTGDRSGDPREVTTQYNQDPSMDRELTYFCDCVRGVVDDRGASVEDAVRTLGLVQQIYYADETWRTTQRIADPTIVLRRLGYASCVTDGAS